MKPDRLVLYLILKVSYIKKFLRKPFIVRSGKIKKGEFVKC